MCTRVERQDLEGSEAGDYHMIKIKKGLSLNHDDVHVITMYFCYRALGQAECNTYT